jgi:hypothetical protein
MRLALDLLRTLPRLRFRSVSWLGGLFGIIELVEDAVTSARPSHRESRTAIACSSKPTTVARAENFRLTVARRRRLFTVFPCAESRVIVDGAMHHCSSPLAKVNCYLRDVSQEKL